MEFARNKLKTPFFDAYLYEQGEQKIFAYRSGLMVYEERFEKGKLVSNYWNEAGYPHNVLENETHQVKLNRNSAKPAYVFELEADGISAENELEFIDYSKALEAKENGTEFLHIVITLKASVRPITFKVHTELDGTPVMTRYIEIINNSENTVLLSNIVPFAGMLDVFKGWPEYSKTRELDEVYSLGYNDNSSWCMEGQFKWHKVHEGGNSILGRYEAGRFRHPWCVFRNNLKGTIFNMQLAHTGGYELKFNVTEVIEQEFPETAKQVLYTTFAAAIKSPNPQYALEAGESFIAPEVHFEKIFGSLDDSVNNMHKHMRKSVFTLPRPQGITGILAIGMGAERIMDMRAIKHFADVGAEVGAEIFILDAGWYCPIYKHGEWHARVGDWEFDRTLYPGGGEEILAYLKSKGLKFGLWFDAERIGWMSAIAKEHPEWVGERYSDDTRVSSLDMSNPDAVAWIEEVLAEMFVKYEIELFRLDYNIGEEDIFMKLNSGETTVCSTLKAYENINAMYNRLRKRFPNVFFENCAGGGGRTDLGLLKNFTHSWVSDWQIAPRSFAITNGMTMCLPPEYADRLVSGMFSHTKASIDFMVRQTLFGKPTTNSYNAMGTDWNTEQVYFVKHSYDIYKDFIRPYAETTMIYHHTPEIYGTRPQGTGIIERANDDCTRSAIGIFRLTDATAEPDVIVYPRGLDESFTYKVFSDNSFLKGRSGEYTAKGSELINNGIRVRLEDSLTSELLLIEKV